MEKFELKITLDELLKSGILSVGQRLRVFNCDHPMERNGTHYFLAEYNNCSVPQRYIYKINEKGNVVYDFVLDENGNKVPILNEKGTQKFGTDSQGNKIPLFKKKPVIIGEREEYKYYCKIKDFIVSHIYCEEFYDEFGKVKDTGIAIQVFGGDF